MALKLRVACAYSTRDDDEHCGLSFPDNGRHKEHLRNKHKILIVQCSICYLCFRGNTEREDHKRKKHSGSSHRRSSSISGANTTSGDPVMAQEWRGILRYVFPEYANARLPSPYVPNFRDALDACTTTPPVVTRALRTVVWQAIRRLGLPETNEMSEVAFETHMLFAKTLLEGLSNLDAETESPWSENSLMGQGTGGPSRAPGSNGGGGAIQQQQHSGAYGQYHQQQSSMVTGLAGYGGGFSGSQIMGPQQQGHQTTSALPMSSSIMSGMSTGMGQGMISVLPYHNTAGRYAVSSTPSAAMVQYELQQGLGTTDTGLYGAQAIGPPGTSGNYQSYGTLGAGYPGDERETWRSQPKDSQKEGRSRQSGR